MKKIFVVSVVLLFLLGLLNYTNIPNLSMLETKTFAESLDNPYSENLSSSTKEKLDNIVLLILTKQITKSDSDFNNRINKISIKIKQLKTLYSTNSNILHILNYLDFEIDKILLFQPLTSLECDKESIGRTNTNNNLEVCTEIVTERNGALAWEIADGLYCFRGDLKQCTTRTWQGGRVVSNYCGKHYGEQMKELEENWKGGFYELDNSRDKYYDNLGSCEMIDVVKYEWEKQCLLSQHKIGKGSSVECKENIIDCKSGSFNGVSFGTGVKTWNGLDSYGPCIAKSCNDGYYSDGKNCTVAFAWKTNYDIGSCSETCGRGTKPVDVFCEDRKNNISVSDDNCNSNKPNDTIPCFGATSCTGPKKQCSIDYEGLRIGNSTTSGQQSLTINTQIECLYSCEKQHNGMFGNIKNSDNFKLECLFDGNPIKTY